MRFRNLFTNRGLGVNLLASFCFLMLAVYGWGMTWEKIGSFLLVLFILLGGLIAIAAFLGWFLHKLKRKDDYSFINDDSQSPVEDDQKK